MGRIGRPTIQIGSQGDDVKYLQSFLSNNGYGVQVDGIFGNETRNALMNYQKDLGLSADGIAGTKTWYAIGNGYASTKKDKSNESYQPIYMEYKAPEFKVSDATSSAELNKNKSESAVTNYQYGKQEDLDNIINSILNRKDFSYDLNGDALYQQYKDKYIQQGKLAMGDAIGQASAMTGGYGNSYAQSVGQQAYQAQLQNLNDIVPELYQMALDKYNREGDDLYNQYGLLTDDKNAEYNRLVADRDYAANNYNTLYGNDWNKYTLDTGIGQSEHQNAFNAAYQKWADDQSQANWEKEYDLNKRQVDLEEKKYNDSKVVSNTQESDKGSTETWYDKLNNEGTKKEENEKPTTKYDYKYVLAQVKDDVRNGEDISSISNYLRLAWKSGYITDKEYEKLKATYVPRSSASGTGVGGHYTY